MFHSPTRRRLAGLLLTLILCAPATAHAAGVRVEVSPETLSVAPGDTFTVQVTVPASGDPFNTCEGVLSFDDTVLQFVGRSQVEQEGALFLDGCPGHGTFYVFSSDADSLSFLDSMLGAGCLVAGPGTMLDLRFVSLGPTGSTYVRVRRMKFYNDGFYVNPVLSSDALINIGGTLGVTPPPRPQSAPRLVVSPNPSRGSCWLSPAGPVGDASEIRIVDTAGRLVRRLTIAPGAAGRAVPWDGQDADGRRVPPGVYAAVLAGSTRAAHTLVIRLP